MLHHQIKEHPQWGSCLFVNNGIVEIGIPLEFGLRIGHFSFLGEENVFYEHPKDADYFCTEDGWRIRGGHRLWLAPESKKDYYPDNTPISYELEENAVMITQEEDPWQKVVKSFRIELDGSSIQITHKIKNTGTEDLTCALWAISVMAPGGVETIRFALRDGGMDHWHRISMWDYTSLGDPRVTYTREQITIRHLPLDTKYKIGVGHPYGPVRYENRGVAFVKHFEIDPDREYPDANVSYETFFSKYMAEMESLSPLGCIKPGESMEHREILELIRLNEREEVSE